MSESLLNEISQSILLQTVGHTAGVMDLRAVDCQRMQSRPLLFRPLSDKETRLNQLIVDHFALKSDNIASLNSQDEIEQDDLSLLNMVLLESLNSGYLSYLHELNNELLQNSDTHLAINPSVSTISAKSLLSQSSEIYALRNQLDKLQNQNKDLIRRNKTRTKEIVELDNDPQSTVALNTVKLQLKDVIKKIDTIKPIILGLILGAGLNWAEDIDLGKLVLECSNDED
ncbi:uncharacterized protein V1516DRAFT_666694 [Lipomyces oligophaga]|uniref:uncharacterized protein n=1 Tax=Lipomyces oligophaga TaxID=45792 RepID=UPI0034CFDBAA